MHLFDSHVEVGGLDVAGRSMRGKCVWLFAFTQILLHIHVLHHLLM